MSASATSPGPGADAVGPTEVAAAAALLEGIALRTPAYVVACTRILSAREALQKGLLSRVVDDEKVFEDAAACAALLSYRRAAGYDCSTLVNGKPNRRCWGVWERQLKRHAKCMAAQGGE